MWEENVTNDGFAQNKIFPDKKIQHASMVPPIFAFFSFLSTRTTHYENYKIWIFKDFRRSIKII